jgi:hypothetical protein
MDFDNQGLAELPQCLPAPNELRCWWEGLLSPRIVLV